MLDSLIPTEKARVMDMVQSAGIDVGDWKAFKGGESKAAANPKYCYEWAFVDPKVVVLNLWHRDMELKEGQVIHRTNFRERAFRQHKPIWKKRDMRLDEAIRTALVNKLPIRVIILEGKKRDTYDPNSKPSSVQYRLLDTIPWAVTTYNANTGECVLTRGAGFADQFTLYATLPEGTPEQQAVSGTAFIRDFKVRRHALQRSNGRCEWCGEYGFRMANGDLYLETHHVIPLSEGGLDSPRNVVALCPNHHREAHHGVMRDEMRQKLRNLIA